MKHDAARAFLGELIDDAGLFPPARLSMADALAANERALASDGFWLVGRFVVSASRFGELIAALDDAPRPLPVAVVIDGMESIENVAAALGIAARARVDRIAIESLEVPLARIPGATYDERLETYERAIAVAGLPEMPDSYVEVALGDTFEAQIVALQRARGRGFALAAKFRCGGLAAGMVPSAGVLAHALWTANRLEVPCKATAGLHHALPFDDPSIGTRTHGFLNVVGAAVLAHARGVDAETLASLLCDRDPANFHLDRERFAWSGIGANASEIGAARAHRIHSYGSCSLEEPAADLRALAILPALVR